MAITLDGAGNGVIMLAEELDFHEIFKSIRRRWRC